MLATWYESFGHFCCLACSFPSFSVRSKEKHLLNTCKVSSSVPTGLHEIIYSELSWNGVQEMVVWERAACPVEAFGLSPRTWGWRWWSTPPLGTWPVWISSFTFGRYGPGLCLIGVAVVGGVVRLKPCSSKIICCPTLGCWSEVPGSWIPFPYPGLVMKGVFWAVEGTSKISGPWRLGCGRVTSWGSSSSQERLEPKKQSLLISSPKYQQ